MCRTWRPHRLVALALCLPLLSSLTAARERLVRRFDLERGLPFSEVYSVGQDSRGFLWIATGGGLFRYDGLEFRPWPRDTFRGWASDLVTGPNGEVLFRDYTGILYQVPGERISRVPT